LPDNELEPFFLDAAFIDSFFSNELDLQFLLQILWRVSAQLFKQKTRSIENQSGWMMMRF
jgi:hypothetical protein